MSQSTGKRKRLPRTVKQKSVCSETTDCTDKPIVSTKTEIATHQPITRALKNTRKISAGKRQLKKDIKGDNNDYTTNKSEIKNEIGTETKLNDLVKRKKSSNVKMTVSHIKNVDQHRERNKETGSSMFIGAHVSIAGGLHNAILEADKIGAKAIGIFLRSQRQWNAKPLDEVTVRKFNETCDDYQFPKQMILPHGSYLLNLGSPVEETREKSVNLLVDELQRCDMLGISLYNFHPGSTCKKISVKDCIQLIADGINHGHNKSKDVITVIENMSGQGGTIGGKFEELAEIINLVHDKSRVGVCLDTCHMFAAGYNIKTKDGYEAMKQEFDAVVGFQYLKAFHLNDSKGKVGCNLDRHEDIGRGELGLEPFRWIVNDPQFTDIPMVLETPGYEAYDEAIIKLYSLIQ